MIRPTENRPVFLDLTRIHMPLAARVSILHRISGLLLILVVPFVLYLLELSLSGASGFARARDLLASPGGEVSTFLVLWAFFHHLCAGVRYLLIDLDVGVRRGAMVSGARAVLAAGFVLAVAVWGMLP